MKSIVTLLFLALTAPSFADDIQPHGDEFNSAVTRSAWQRLNDTEGWNADQLELWDLNPTYAPGHMVLAPHSSGWYMDLRGVLVYKEITGDFIVTTRMRLSRRGINGLLPNQAGYVAQQGAPNREFSLAGIFVRNPRAIVSAAPSPIPSETPLWPAPTNGQPGHYMTDWSPDGDNYLFLSYGSAGSQGTWQYEVKTTTDGDSDLYFNNLGVPNNDENAQWITLQMIRVGNTIVVMRKHGDATWVIENRYTQNPVSAYQQLPNFGNTLQIGITTYTDWNVINTYYAGGDHALQFQHNYSVLDGPSSNPDLIAEVDYYRFQRPDPALTEQALQSLPITFSPAPLGGTAAQLLPDNEVGALLGDNANSPSPPLDEDPDGDGTSTLIEIIMGSNPALPDANPISTMLANDDFHIQFPHQSNLNPITLEIQSSNNMINDWATIATRSSTGWLFDLPHQIEETTNEVIFRTPILQEDTFYRIEATAP
ncbi:hypothetical protein [Rubritalea sp.]|uniref:hypothetical protein n=1 Tax=Rubritalea sp. TaxID=2109375 RepID=UPI003EF63FB6